MLNKKQIKLVQIAVKKAGIRESKDDRRYRLLLGQYKNKKGRVCKSCKDLNRYQLTDILAICEARGWRHPVKSEDFYRKKAVNLPDSNFASPGQIEVIKKLAGDLGWQDYQINGFVDRMSGGLFDNICMIPPNMAYNIIEALKAMFNRKNKTNCKSAKQIKNKIDTEVKNGKKIAREDA